MTSETDEDKVAMDSDVDLDSRKSRGDRKNKKPKFINKVIIRRLPPTMTEETFLQQIEPLPSNDRFNFVPADWSLGHFATSRAYIYFTDQADVFLFKDKFDGYVFVDAKGVEYPAIVEFAPMQQLPKSKAPRVDSKAGTIEQDAGYISFLESLANVDGDAGKPEMKMEYSYQIKDVKMITTTPLLEFLANKQGERREERRRKTEDKKDKNRKKEGSVKYSVQVNPDTGDRKRRDGGGRSRNRSNVSRSVQSGVVAEPTDGVVVRTVKSRILDRNSGRRTADRSAKKPTDGSGGNSSKFKEHKDAANRGLAEEAQQHGDGLRETNTRKGYRNPFQINRAAAEEKGKPGADVVILKSSSTPSASQPVSSGPAAERIAEEPAKRPMDSRRDRRAARKEARHMRFEAIRTAERRGDGDAADAKGLSEKANGKALPAMSASGMCNSSPEEQRQSVVVTPAARRASHDSSSGGEHSRDHSKAQRELRIRNKDRPTLQIYQPGRRTRGVDSSDKTDGPDCTVVSPGTANERGEKIAPPFFNVRPKSVTVAEKDTAADSVAPPPTSAKPLEKRVSRYSERRNKQRKDKADAESLCNDAGSGVASLVRDMHTASLKEAP